MTDKIDDTREDVLDLVSTLAEEGWSIDERREAAAMLRRLLDRIERAEAANQARPDYNLYCENCGRAHILDTSIPSEIWNLIAPQNSILCTTCIDDMLSNAGLKCEAEFYFVGKALRGKLYSDARAEKAEGALATARADAIEECARVCEEKIHRLILHEIQKLAALAGDKEAE